MDFPKEITLIGTSVTSYFDKNEFVFIKIFLDKREVLVKSIDTNKEHLYIIVPSQSTSIIFNPIEKKLSIEEWKVWEDDLNRKNKSIVVNHFEKVEIIVK